MRLKLYKASFKSNEGIHQVKQWLEKLEKTQPRKAFDAKQTKLIVVEDGRNIELKALQELNKKAVEEKQIAEFLDNKKAQRDAAKRNKENN